MKQTALIFLFAAVLSFTSGAQTNNITGKWKYSDIDKSTRADSTQKKMVETMFGDMSIYFRPDQTYHAYMLRDDRGKWSYDTVVKKVVLSSDKGTESKLDFKVLNDSVALLSMGKNGGIIMKRVPVINDENIVPPPTVQVLISITPEQLANKWFIKGRNKPGASQEILEMAAKMLKGAFFKFDEDGKYKAEIMGIEQKGSWDLSNNNTVLTLNVDGEKMTWKVKFVTATELELYKGNTEEVWKFSTKE